MVKNLTFLVRFFPDCRDLSYIASSQKPQRKDSKTFHCMTIPEKTQQPSTRAMRCCPVLTENSGRATQQVPRNQLEHKHSR